MTTDEAITHLEEPPVITPTVRRQTQWKPLSKEAFRERFYARFQDPAFDAVKPELYDS